MCSEKQQLRRHFLAVRAAMQQAEKQETDRQIVRRVLEMEPYRNANMIFCYVATPAEIDTRPILEQALSTGKTVCVPRCGQAGSMTARRISSLDVLTRGRYGILEPPDTAEMIPPEQIKLVLAPALAADRRGYRLGYGGGYYDRFLEQVNPVSTVCVVLCVENRLVDRLPAEPYDRRCHWVVTERQVLRLHEKQ